MYFVPVTNEKYFLFVLYIFVIFSHIVYVLKASRETSIVLIELPSLNKEFIIIIIIIIK